MHQTFRHITCDFIRTLRFSICLIIGCLSHSLSAQTTDGTKYVPIMSLAELTDDTPCLIVAADSVLSSKWEGGIYAMTTSISAEDGKMLGTRCSKSTSTQVIENVVSKMLWRLQQTDEDTYYIRSNATGNYLSASGSNKMKLQNSASDALEWTITIKSGGIFRLMAPDGRYLGENLQTATTSYFSRYSGSGTSITELRIFVAQDKTPPQGEATMQPQSTPVVLRSAERVYGLADATGILCGLPAADYLTDEGLMANDGSLQFWTFDVDSGNRFRMMRSDGQGLNYELQSSAAPALWSLRKGFITTEETPCRYLMESQGRLQLIYDTDAMFRTAKAVTFAIMGEEADTLLLSSGTKVLTGAWSAGKLAAIDWTGTLGLDLCKATFPTRLHSFLYRPTIGNTFVYISEDKVSTLPSDCERVVGCNDDDEAILIRGGRLYDKHPFAINRKVTVSEGQLEYARPITDDGGWQTVCLPFSFSVPREVTVESCVEMAKDNLIFAPVSTVNGGTAVIYCESAVTQGTDSIRFYSADGQMQPSLSETDSPLCGTYLWGEVDDSAGPAIYLLNATGDTFVRASSGSQIPPFRAYIIGNNAPAYRICHTTTELTHTASDSRPRHTENGFTMDGRRLTLKSVQSLSPGIYIISGKKVLCH